MLLIVLPPASWDGVLRRGGRPGPVLQRHGHAAHPGNDPFNAPFLPIVQAYEDVAVQTDGKVVLIARNSSNSSGLHVERRNADGTLDTTFAIDGNDGFTDTIELIPGEIVHPRAVLTAGSMHLRDRQRSDPPTAPSTCSSCDCAPTARLIPPSPATASRSRPRPRAPRSPPTSAACSMHLDGRRFTVVGQRTQPARPDPSPTALVLRLGIGGAFDTTLGGGGALVTSVMPVTHAEEAGRRASADDVVRVARCRRHERGRSQLTRLFSGLPVRQ